MAQPRALRPLLLIACAGAALAALAVAADAADHDYDGEVLYHITDEEFYQMPDLFGLDEYEGCLATRGAYCLGSFELAPPAGAPSDHPLYRLMQGYSANWVDNFNHTRLHRGLCVTRACAPPTPPTPAHAHTHGDVAGIGTAPALPDLDAWFASCVNASTMSSHNLSARPLSVEYCAVGPARPAPPLSASERAFAALLAALLVLAALSTALDLTLPEHARKSASWALCWSVPANWRALQSGRELPPAPPARSPAPPTRSPAPPARSPHSCAGADTDLRAFDGLRVLCMMCVVIEHVCWLVTQHYLVNTRQYEQMRRATEVMLMINSTLVVQIFFLMSSFLLAHKLLAQRRRGHSPAAVSTLGRTMLDRLIRVSPSYWVVVWFAASWWPRLGRGPLWAPMVEAESAVCRRKWWTHLLYLNNVLYADDKCLIQTWYLAADMQLYVWSLLLTLALARLRRGALPLLAALQLAAVAATGALAYRWRLVPTYVMHRPELVRVAYSGDASFNVLYQSPLGNAPAALAGLLLAHAHHAAIDNHLKLHQYKVFRWVSVWSPPLAVWWAATSPALLGPAGGSRAAAAALAALERPVFSALVSLGLLGAMHHVTSPLRSLLSWRRWAVPARLSFGVLLLHMPLNKALVAARLAPSALNRQQAILEWFGMALLSYLCALPLSLLVELPPQRLLSAVRAVRARSGAAAGQAAVGGKHDT